MARARQQTKLNIISGSMVFLRSGTCAFDWLALYIRSHLLRTEVISRVLLECRLFQPSCSCWTKIEEASHKLQSPGVGVASTTSIWENAMTSASGCPSSTTRGISRIV